MHRYHTRNNINWSDYYYCCDLYISTAKIRIHLGQHLETINGHHFLPNDNIRRVYIVFGLKPQDFSDCHKTDALVKPLGTNNSIWTLLELNKVSWYVPNKKDPNILGLGWKGDEVGYRSRNRSRCGKGIGGKIQCFQVFHLNDFTDREWLSFIYHCKTIIRSGV